VQIQVYPYVGFWINNFLRAGLSHRYYKEVRKDTVDRARKNDQHVQESFERVQELEGMVDSLIKQRVASGRPLADTLMHNI
jgi:hypothetical protein